MMKKLVSMLLILSLVFSGAMSFGAEVPPEWALPALENLASYDIVAEAFYDHFDQKVTRAEFAYLGVRLYETLTGTLAETGSDRFIDTKDEWVLKAKHHGIVNGYSDGSFKPDQAIRQIGRAHV